MAEPLNATFFTFHKREKGGVLLGASVAFGVLMALLFIAFGVGDLGDDGSGFLHLVAAKWRR